MAQDSRDHLIFDTDAKGAAWFAQEYSGGTPIANFLDSKSKLPGANGNMTWQDKVQGIPGISMLFKMDGFYVTKTPMGLFR